MCGCCEVEVMRVNLTACIVAGPRGTCQSQQGAKPTPLTGPAPRANTQGGAPLCGRTTFCGGGIFRAGGTQKGAAISNRSVARFLCMTCVWYKWGKFA